MRARFARTLRLYMRDVDVYTNPGIHVWTADDSNGAEALLQTIKNNVLIPDEAIPRAARALAPDFALSTLTRIWERMQTFPYIFEVAAARRNVDVYHLDGTPAIDHGPSTAPQVSVIHYRGWQVSLKDFQNFRALDRLSPALFEHFAQMRPRTSTTVSSPRQTD